MTLTPELQKRIDGNTRLEFFDSAYEFAAHTNKLAGPLNRFRHDKNMEWFGKETWDDALKNVSKGWPHVIEQAERLLGQLEAEGLLSQGYKGFTQSVAGIFPNVPAAIIGAPESMFDRAEDRGEASPIRVVVDVAVDAYKSPDTILKRGTAIIALVLALSARRPVELYCMAGLDADPNKQAKRSGAAFAVVRLDTRPLDIAAVSYCLASAAFYRRLFMGYAYEYGYTGMWAYNMWSPEEHKWNDALRRGLQLDAQDLYIPGAAVNTIAANPLEWVRDQLSTHIIENQNA